MTFFRVLSAASLSGLIWMGGAGAAEASPVKTFGKAYQCAKDAGLSSVKVMVDVAEKGALIAEIGANASACTAAAGGTSVPYGVTLGAISAIKVASPETVPTGKCEPSVKGLVARPFGEGVSYIMPPGSVRTKLLAIVNSDTAKEQMWSAIETVPGVQPYTVQVGCACTTIDNGIALTDIRAVSDAVSQVSSSCASMLDSLGLGFINDLDDAAEELAHETYSSMSGAYDEIIGGESDPAPYGVVYDTEFAGGRGFYTRRFALQGPAAEASIPGELSNRISSCAGYYDARKHSLSNGTKICTEMANRLVADVKTDGLRLYQESKMLEEIGASWNKLFETNWAWRLAPSRKSSGKQSSFPVNDSAGRAAVLSLYTTGGLAHPEADALKALAGGLDCSAAKRPVVKAECKASGIYAAAREGWAYAPDKDAAIKIAQVGISPRLSKRVADTWDAERSDIGRYYLWWWLGQNKAGSGQWGCPANEPLLSACVADLKASFDKGCFETMRDAVAYAPSSASIVFGPVAGAMSSCQSLLATRTKLAGDLANYNVDMSPAAATDLLCQPYADRTAERAACSNMVLASYNKCALDAVKAGFSASQPGHFKACWSGERAALKANMGKLMAVRVPPTVTSKVATPDEPLSSNPGVKLPAPDLTIPKPR
jgi:hypothetical protein